MSFSTFEISELADESDNDYALEFQTGDSMHGILVTEEELQMLGDGITRTIDGNPEDADGLEVGEYAGGGNE
jgi:hypothetical protein